MSIPCSLCNMDHPGNENPDYCKEAIQALLDLNDERKAEVERLKSEDAKACGVVFTQERRIEELFSEGENLKDEVKRLNTEDAKARGIIFAQRGRIVALEESLEMVPEWILNDNTKRWICTFCHKEREAILHGHEWARKDENGGHAPDCPRETALGKDKR